MSTSTSSTSSLNNKHINIPNQRKRKLPDDDHTEASCKKQRGEYEDASPVQDEESFKDSTNRLLDTVQGRLSHMRRASSLLTDENIRSLHDDVTQLHTRICRISDEFDRYIKSYKCRIQSMGKLESPQLNDMYRFLRHHTHAIMMTFCTHPIKEGLRYKWTPNQGLQFWIQTKDCASRPYDGICREIEFEARIGSKYLRYFAFLDDVRIYLLSIKDAICVVNKKVTTDHLPILDTHTACATSLCTICLDSMSSSQHVTKQCAETGRCVTLRCGHQFHSGCINTWLGTGMLRCPVCRSEQKPRARNTDLIPDGGCLLEKCTNVLKKFMLSTCRSRSIKQQPRTIQLHARGEDNAR